MKNCVVKEGEKWRVCPNHKNSKGGHGEYMCIYVYRKNEAWNAPHYCKRKDYELPWELFKL